MNWRFTLIVVLVFAALAVFAYTQRSAPALQVGEGAPTATPEALLALDEGEVQEVTVEGEDGSYTLSRVAGGWQVDGQDTNDQVDGLVGRLAGLSVIRDLPSDRDPDDYGFASPSMTVTLRTASGDEHALQVGDDTPVDYNVYVRLLDAARIVIVSRSDFESLREWFATPPLAPTPTPEVSPTVEGGEGEDTQLGPEGTGTPEADEGATATGEAGDGTTEALTATVEAAAGTPVATLQATAGATAGATAVATAGATAKATAGATAGATAEATVKATESSADG